MSAADTDEVMALVKWAVRQHEPGAGDLEAGTLLFEGGLEMTSLRFFRVVGELEEQLDIEFHDADLTALAGATLGDLCELAASRHSEKAA